MNKVILEGLVTENPTIRYFGYGYVRADFKLYTEEILPRNTGEPKQIHLYHKIQAWGFVAQEIEENLRAGQSIRIDGRISYDSESKQETTVDVLSVECLSFCILKNGEIQNRVQDKTVNEVEIDWSNFFPSQEEDPMA